MSIHFAQGKLQEEERKPILQEVQTRAKAAALRAIRPLLSAFLDEELTAELCRGTSSEEHSEWETLLRRLWQRGVQLEKGLQLVVRDGSGG